MSILDPVVLKKETLTKNQQFSNPQHESYFTDNPLLQHDKDAANNLVNKRFNTPQLYLNCQCSTTKFDEYSSAFKDILYEHSSSALFVKLVVKSLQRVSAQTKGSDFDFQLDKIKINHLSFGQQLLDGLSDKDLDDIYEDFKVSIFFILIIKKKE